MPAKPPALAISARPEAPWMAGIRAARANIVPGLIVQGLMLALLLAYYFHPPMRDWLDALARLKARWSYGYSGLSAIIAGGIIPEALRIVVFQKGKIHRTNVSNLLFAIPFWCFMGTVVDYFYRSQDIWFGSEAIPSVVVKKVLVDQILYNSLFAAPFTAWLYDWKNSGYPSSGMGHFFTLSYYRITIVPALVATWGVWVPIVTILYSLPSTLQIPLFGLALSLWVILYNYMSEHRVHRPRTASL